jgi:GT2 family glycosyltransferase
MPELVIILLNYRRPEETIACIESIRRSTYTDYEILVVDNASSDGSPDRIRSQCPGIQLLQNSENLGFAAGNNTGLELFKSGSYPYALLLNNDTEVAPDTLAALMTAMRSNPAAGILGAKIYFYDRPNILWFAGGAVNPGSGAVSHRGMLETDRGQYDRAGSCDFVTGCCLLVRRAVVDRIGLLDPAFFAYFEDADFCLRARRAGFDVRYEPAARLWHKVSSTTQWDSPVYLYFTLRNRLILVKKNSTFLKSLPYLPALIYFYARQFTRLLLKWRNLPGARAAWLGMVDGLRSCTGSDGRGRLDRIGGSTRKTGDR